MNPQGATRFSLRFLRGSCPFAYDYARWSASVRRLDASDAIVALDEDDVRIYEVRGAPVFELALTLTDAAAARLLAARNAVVEAPVIVTLDGALLYAAREYSPFGAAGITFPVVHLDRLGEGVVLVRPSQGYSTDLSLIDRPELRALFHSLDRLRPPSPR